MLSKMANTSRVDMITALDHEDGEEGGVPPNL